MGKELKKQKNDNSVCCLPPQFIIGEVLTRFKVISRGKGLIGDWNYSLLKHKWDPMSVLCLWEEYISCFAREKTKQTNKTTGHKKAAINFEWFFFASYVTTDTKLRLKLIFFFLWKWFTAIFMSLNLSVFHVANKRFVFKIRIFLIKLYCYL